MRKKEAVADGDSSEKPSDVLQLKVCYRGVAEVPEKLPKAQAVRNLLIN